MYGSSPPVMVPPGPSVLTRHLLAPSCRECLVLCPNLMIQTRKAARESCRDRVSSTEEVVVFSSKQDRISTESSLLAGEEVSGRIAVETEIESRRAGNKDSIELAVVKFFNRGEVRSHICDVM